MCPVRVAGRGRIGINAHLLSGRADYRRAGIHHYIARLLGHLPQEATGFQYTVFTNRASDFSVGMATQIVASRLPTYRPFLRILWEQLVWPLQLMNSDLDLIHSMAFVTPVFRSKPAVVTVYDLSFIHYPDRFPTLQRLYLASQTRRSCQTSRRVVTISESARQDVHHHFSIPLQQIDLVYPGVDSTFSIREPVEIEAFRQRQHLPARYILHVGTLQPRKNISTLLEAFAKLNQSDTVLVLVGGKGWFYDEIEAKVRSLDLAKRVHFTGYVADVDLPLWYNAAAVLVFPSEYEGFGMPIAQAMACGTPVIAANTSAVPEVSGEAARLFDPHDVATLTEHLAIVLDDPKVATEMRDEGLLQARKFTWKQAGRDMVAVYHRALNKI